jgi:hypothetical protein
MRRITTDPRPNWQKRVEEFGLYYHTIRGEPYWDESAFYQFTAYEIDKLEEATNALHRMCLDLVREVIEKRMFGLFLIPQQFEEYIIRSWEAGEPSVYGRFDLAYDGVGSPKMLEYNADTPTALVEASVAQWMWLKDVDERADPLRGDEQGGHPGGLHHRGVHARHRHPGRGQDRVHRRHRHRLGPRAPVLRGRHRVPHPPVLQTVPVGVDRQRGVRPARAHRRHALGRTRVEDDSQL